MTKMYFLLFLAFILSAMSAQAGPRLGFDGCYQLYMSEGMFPVICLDGTTQEGIGGAGARLAIFDSDTTSVAQCMFSTRSIMTDTSFVFERGGKAELTLENLRLENGRKRGAAKIGKSNLEFVQLAGPQEVRLLGVVNSSNSCF